MKKHGSRILAWWAAMATAAWAAWPEPPNALFVSPDGGGRAPYRSWATASRSIQAAIETAAPGAAILVAPGVYQEQIDFLGKAVTVMSLYEATGEERYLAETVIDGGRTGRVAVFQNGETEASVLSGFTLANGYSTNHGGGVFIDRASPTLRRLVVTRCETRLEGGGLYMANSSPSLQDLVVRGNTSSRNAGGIRITAGLPKIARIIVENNRAGEAGGGMLIYHSDCTLDNALFSGNVGEYEGGGALFLDGANIRLEHCTIENNESATGVGGGLNISYCSHPRLVRCVVKGNRPEQISFNTRWYNMAVTLEDSYVEGGVAGIPTRGKGPVHTLGGILNDPALAELGFAGPAAPAPAPEGADGRGSDTLIVQQPNSAYSIFRVGFSNRSDGDQDVTEFYADETLHVGVTDVDIPPSSTNSWFLVMLIQPGEDGEVKESARLTGREDGSFSGALPLARFRPGPVGVAVMGRLDRVRVVRESVIHVRPPPGHSTRTR